MADPTQSQSEDELTCLNEKLNECRSKLEVACSTLEIVKKEREIAQRALMEQSAENKRLAAELQKLRAPLNFFASSHGKVDQGGCRPLPVLSEADIRQIFRDELMGASNDRKNDAQAIQLQKEVIVRRGRLLADIFNCDEGQDLPIEIKRRIDAEMLK